MRPSTHRTVIRMLDDLREARNERFPNDPVADRARHERLKKEGRIRICRRPQYVEVS